jgi:pimeloyl-ACP methyl ester carboxylesterase
MKKIIFSLLTVVITAAVLSCSKGHPGPGAAANPKTFVIVPGAWSGPYAWDSVKASLEKTGNKVVIVQLPGHGSDSTPPQNLTLDVYRDKVISVIDSIGGQVILVGHSLGGAIISEVAEKAPSKIEKLVYVAGFIPLTGQSVLALASTDTASVLGSSLRPSADNLTLAVLSDQIINSFILDGTEQEQNLVLANYRVEPAIPLTNAVTLTAANYGSVTKVYIKTLMDHAITPTLQNRMLAATPRFSAVYQLNTSHSPFLVKPDSVAILLTKIAN